MQYVTYWTQPKGKRRLFYAFGLCECGLIIQNRAHDLLKALPFNSIGKVLLHAGSHFLENSDSGPETVGHHALPMGENNGISAAVKHSNDLTVGTVGADQLVCYPAHVFLGALHRVLGGPKYVSTRGAGNGNNRFSVLVICHPRLQIRSVAKGVEEIP